MSSSDPFEVSEGGFLPGNARVVMGVGDNGPSEMTVHQIEGTKTQELNESTELAFWARVRAKAQAKAKEILNQAMVDAEAIRAQAQQEGFAQGVADSQQAIDHELANMGNTLAAALGGIEAGRPALWAQHRREFATLLKMAVEKTIHAELSERRREILSGLLDQSLELLDTRSGFTLLVNPQDEQAAGELLEQARAAHPGLGSWRIRSDPSMTPGGVRLESEAGLVDNTVDSRFEQIADLLDRVSFSEPEPDSGDQP